MSVCLNFRPVGGLSRCGSKTVSKSFSLGWDTAHEYFPAPLHTCFLIVCLKKHIISRNIILYIKDEAFGPGWYNGTVTTFGTSPISPPSVSIRKQKVQSITCQQGFVIWQKPHVFLSPSRLLWIEWFFLCILVICTCWDTERLMWNVHFKIWVNAEALNEITLID